MVLPLLFPASVLCSLQPPLWTCCHGEIYLQWNVPYFPIVFNKNESQTRESDENHISFPLAVYTHLHRFKTSNPQGCRNLWLYEGHAFLSCSFLVWFLFLGRHIFVTPSHILLSLSINLRIATHIYPK